MKPNIRPLSLPCVYSFQWKVVEVIKFCRRKLHKCCAIARHLSRNSWLNPKVRTHTLFLSERWTDGVETGSTWLLSLVRSWVVGFGSTREDLQLLLRHGPHGKMYSCYGRYSFQSPVLDVCLSCLPQNRETAEEGLKLVTLLFRVHQFIQCQGIKRCRLCSSLLHIVAQYPCRMTGWCDPALPVAKTESTNNPFKANILALPRIWGFERFLGESEALGWPEQWNWAFVFHSAPDIISDPAFNQLLLENA